MTVIGVFMILGLLTGRLTAWFRDMEQKSTQPFQEILREMYEKHTILYLQRTREEQVAYYIGWVLIVGVLAFAIEGMSFKRYTPEAQILVGFYLGLGTFAASLACFTVGFSRYIPLVVSPECIWYTNSQTGAEPGIIAWAEVRSVEIYQTPPSSLTPEGEIADLLEKGPHWNNLIIHPIWDETLVVPGIGGNPHKIRKTLQSYAPTVPITVRIHEEEEEEED